MLLYRKLFQLRFEIRYAYDRVLNRFFHDSRNIPYRLNSFDCMRLLQSCRDIQQLKVTHGLIITNCYQQNPLLAAKLVSCYMDKGASVNDARLVFECTKERDVLLWNVMIQAYGTVGPHGEAVSLFQQMRTCIKPNIYTFPFVLKACAAMGDGRKTKEIHADILKAGIQDNVFVCNSLISAYSRCSEIKAACKVFDRIFARDIISWNSMIMGYAQNDCWKEALMLFHRMLTEFPGKPDLITMLSILPACGRLAALQQGLWIHTYLIKNQLEIDMVLGSALIMMYSKCGCLQVARRVFEMIPKRNVVLWNSIIGSYGFHGGAWEALELFSQMLETGVAPDDVTFVYVLSACSHAGCLARAWHYFDMMQNHFGILPTEEHCACVVDMLGRAGKLEEAMSFIRGMSLEPGLEVWGALLGACRIHNKIDLAEAAAKELFVLESTDAGRYVLLANIYAAARRWEDVAKVRRVMREGKVRKPLGCSMIEIERQTHAFGSYDQTHPLLNSIYAMLGWLEQNMKELHSPIAPNGVLQNVEGEVEDEYSAS
ncbi:pentatricopeptide repeat-containing protein At3g46790, chloroplastic-like [Nymphaea colorata]|uniref:pentatricopeptide repeat-containing protein At3g46790, chloroplastic-like n=1 Tax=Nymphaea colorata TaxID=210225 RepID=UPI00129DA7B0|nr:pentatricopeptide repeat-containing protein At3g46790, chloroplastic-like [Nymphaea colorata]